MPPFHSSNISQRMLDEERQVVEQHVAGAAAEDDAERHPQHEVVEVGERDRRRSAPGPLGFQDAARINPAEQDAADIGERIPADRKRPDRDRDRIEGRERDRERDGQRRHSRSFSTARPRGCGDPGFAARQECVCVAMFLSCRISRFRGNERIQFHCVRRARKACACTATGAAPSAARRLACRRPRAAGRRSRDRRPDRFRPRL